MSDTFMATAARRSPFFLRVACGIITSRLHIISCMAVTGIILPSSGRAEKEFVSRLALKEGFEVDEKFHKSFTMLRLSSCSAEHNRLTSFFVAETLTMFYKYRALESVIKGYESDSYDGAAYIGALLSVELEEERKRIYAATEGLDVISVESLIELRLPELKEGWAGLNELGRMLLLQCVGGDDVYSLVPYFITGEPLSPRLTVSGGKRLRLSGGGSEKIIPGLTGDEEKDVVIALMRERPTHIVIRNREEISDKLLRTLRALGE